MTFQALIRHKRARAALGGVLAALLGWQLCWLPLGQFLANLSYDLPFLFTEPGAPADVVLVELDEISTTDLKQTDGELWDRRLHARLVDYLHADGASLVVFDMTFTDAGPDAAADLELASTLVYADREALSAEEEISIAELSRRVHEVKPRFSNDQILHQAESLERRNLLSAVA